MRAGQVAVLMIVAFCLGFFVSSSLKTSHIPDGEFATLSISRGLNYQINTHVDVDPVARTMTTWIREDREHPFVTDTGLIGSTVFTNMTIDCLHLKVAIHEQRVFKHDMTYIGEAAGDGTFDLPTSLVELTSIVFLCRPGEAPGNSVAPKTFSRPKSILST